MDSVPILRTENLTKYYGNNIGVENLNIEVRKGWIYGFLGPNGAGKTTTIKLITGFLRPTKGKVYLFGKDVHDHQEILSKVGIVPDQYGFYPLLNAEEHLEFYGRLYGIEKNKLRDRIDKVIEIVGLSEHRKKKIREYSHGMIQRLCISQALINDPELLVLDEPTTGLDPRGAWETRRLIKSLAEMGKTVFVSSHLLYEVQEICDHIGVINHGHLVAEGAIDELLKRMGMQMGAKKIYMKLNTVDNIIISKLNDIEGVTDAIPRSKTEIELFIKDDSVIPMLSKCVVNANYELLALYEIMPSLQEYFLAVTSDSKGEGDKL